MKIEKIDDRTTNMYYWKEISKSLDDTLYDLAPMSLFIHNSLEFNDLKDLIQRLPGAIKVLFVSLTKTYASIQPSLEGINSEFHVADFISRSLFGQIQEQNGVTFLDMPHEWGDLALKIHELAKDIRPTYIILDSISQFIDFTSILGDHKKLYVFLQQISGIPKGFNSKIILLYDDNGIKDMKYLPSQYFDSIIRLEGIKKPKVNPIVDNDDNREEWLPRVYDSLFREVQRLRKID